MPVPSPLRVLIVDDDFMVASIHARFVERTEGFEVVGSAATGTTALAEVERLDPDLVLLDVHLPDVSGLEVLRRLRAADRHVGVIMVTAAREADTVRAAAAGGAAHYLVKPFEYADFARRLEVFAEAHRALAGREQAAQRDIDAVFAPAPGASAALPKGLSQPTADAVLAAVARAGELSAADCADTVGLSRVSARRYLEHFVDQGRLTVRLQYGGAGRPTRLYRSAASRDRV